MAVLFPSRGLFVLGLDHVDQVGPDGLEGDYAAAIARAYNDWLRDFCSEDPNRLFGAGLLAPHDANLAAEEVDRCVEELGFKTVFMIHLAFGFRPACSTSSLRDTPVYCTQCTM